MEMTADELKAFKRRKFRGFSKEIVDSSTVEELMKMQQDRLVKGRALRAEHLKANPTEAKNRMKYVANLKADQAAKRRLGLTDDEFMQIVLKRELMRTKELAEATTAKLQNEVSELEQKKQKVDEEVKQRKQKKLQEKVEEDSESSDSEYDEPEPPKKVKPPTERKYKAVVKERKPRTKPVPEEPPSPPPPPSPTSVVQPKKPSIVRRRI